MHDTLLRRAATTPMRDAVRGRLTSRLHLAHTLAATDYDLDLAAERAMFDDIVQRIYTVHDSGRVGAGGIQTPLL